MGFIYKIRNCINDFLYIGVVVKEGKSIIDRLNEHIHQSQSGSNLLIHSAIRDFGKEQFEISLLEQNNDKKEIFEREKYFIRFFNTNVTKGGKGYNSTAGGQGTYGMKWSDESKKKISANIIYDKEQLKVDAKALTWNEISQKYNVGVLAMRHLFKQLGIKKKRVQRVKVNQKSAPWSNEDEINVLEYYLMNVDIREIATLFGRTETSILIKLGRLKKKYNLKIRRYRNQHQKRSNFVVKVC